MLKWVLLLLLVWLSNWATYAQADEKIQVSLDTATARAFRLGSINRDSAIKQLSELASQCRSQKYVFGEFSAVMGSGVLYVRNEGSAEPALGYFRSAKHLLTDAAKKEPGVYARWLTCMGAAHAKTGMLDSAMYYYTLSLNAHLKQKEPNYKALLQNYLNLVVVYYEQEQFDKVKQYAQKIVRTAVGKKEFEHELLNAYTVMASVFIETKNFDSSEFYLDKAEKIPIKPNDVAKKLLFEVRGVHFLHKKMPEKAILLFKTALKINNAGSAISLKGLGRAYLQLGNYSLAEGYLLQAKSQEEALRKNTSFLMEVSEDMADLYYETGRYREAYHYRSEAASIGKVIADAKRSKMINQLETKYRSAELEKQVVTKQVSLLSAENKLRSKNVYITIVVALALLLVVVILLLYQKQKTQAHRNAAQSQQQEIDKLKAVLNAEEKERSRIGRELHDDIMGQLSIIRMNLESLPDVQPGLLEAREYQNIKELIDNAGKDIRQTAHNLIPDTLLAEGLVQAIFYFCNNVQRRTGIIINFQHYGYDSMLKAENEISIYRITQELIQNVIKHAHAHSILLQLNQRQDMLTLTVEDDGIGYTLNKQTEGVGLKSIYSRLKTMNGQIDIHKRQPNGTSVTIEINRDKNFPS